MSKTTDLTSIDDADLAAVTGGAHRPGHNDAALTAALTGIKDSVSSLQTQNSSGGNNLSQLLPLMLMTKRGGRCPGGNCGG